MMRLPKPLKVTYWVSIHMLALIGILFVGVFFAIRLKLTNVSGAIDNLSNSFEERALQTQVLGISETVVSPASTTSAVAISNLDQQIQQLSSIKTDKIRDLCSLLELSYISPKNSLKILATKKFNNSESVTESMLFALETHMLNKDDYKANVENCVTNYEANKFDESKIYTLAQSSDSQNLLIWPDKKEWADVAESITKDKQVIEKAAGVAHIEPRLIVSSLMVEQLRMFYSQRELYKKYFEPLKILANSNKISLGVMAIKEETAGAIEAHLKDPKSAYYLGPEMEHVFDYPDGINVGAERYNRLSSFNHYYNYLYGAIYLKQFLVQWKNAGYDIRWRPEVLGTLFNVGFPQSKPNASPKVGGSSVKIDQTNYSFGRLAYEFYFSGELIDQFPITNE